MELNEHKVAPSVAVSDMARAKEFYEGALGLSGGEEVPDGGITYPCGGGSTIHIYPSPANAGQSAATLAAWQVDEVEAAVDELSSKGVAFEQVDMDPIKTNEKGIAELGGDKVAWFKDPDGNTFGLTSG